MSEAVHIGEFVIESVLGEGGMGRVYRARQVALDRWVALKVLSSAQNNKNFTDRFLREAKSAARLVHPNIIQVYSVGDQGGIPYFTMEYVEGEDIEHLLRPDAGGPFSMDEVMEIVRSVTKALALASEHAIVHRDIKPANIMVTKSGLVKVMDFGLAKGAAATDTDHALTQQGLIVGTPAYMSPEQGASKPLDFRSDQYALGCVMYECLTGRPPFKADNVASLIFMHMYEQAEAIASLRPDINAALESVCMKMIAKRAEERFQTPLDLLEALAGVHCNSNLAEVSLARRVTKLMQARKQKVPAAALVREDVLPAPAAKPPSGTEPPPAPAALPSAKTVAHATPGAATPPPAPEPQTPPPQQPARGLKRIEKPAGQAPAPTPTPAPQTPPPRPPPPPSALTSLHTPLPQALPGSSSRLPTAGISGSRLSLAGSGSRLALMSKINETFQKLQDGRWSYRLNQGRCPFSEGLAREVPAKALTTPHEGLGDCVLCNNWNKRTGCAMAYNQELEAQNRYQGLRLHTEQAITWSGAGRFDKAIALLDNYVKTFPDDPEGYRELARVYDRPEYKEKDKRRAVVLYARFAELARQSGRFTQVEISRAEERMAAVRAAGMDSRGSDIHSGFGIPFQCFYRGGVICFAYGVITPDRLLIARAGDVDPDTGIQASEMGGAMTKATSIFRRFMSENAKKEQQAQVKKELVRLASLPPDTLASDASKIISLGMEQVTGVAMSVDSAVNIRNVKINTAQHNHELLFTESGSFRADQCYALIRRKINK
jgi:serine/threonine-protein kinase